MDRSSLFSPFIVFPGVLQGARLKLPRRYLCRRERSETRRGFPPVITRTRATCSLSGGIIALYIRTVLLACSLKSTRINRRPLGVPTKGSRRRVQGCLAIIARVHAEHGGEARRTILARRSEVAISRNALIGLAQYEAEQMLAALARSSYETFVDREFIDLTESLARDRGTPEQ